MIILGPRDADLGGAPDYWREGNWRPHTLDNAPSNCTFTSIPFDKCEIVYEYDARRLDTPTPEQQGWSLVSEGSAIWSHDKTHGALRFDISIGPSFWVSKPENTSTFARGAAYGLFFITQSSLDPNEQGLDFLFHANTGDKSVRGMRGSFSNFWHWRSLTGNDSTPLIKDAAEPSMIQVWHRFGMDAELIGADSTDDRFEKNDGGKTIGDLDGIISNEDRGIFGYGDPNIEQPFALFGVQDKSNPISGMVFVTSFPGRFIRPAFRATAQSKTTKLRLIFCAGNDVKVEDDAAVFLVRYAAPSIGMATNDLPTKEADRNRVTFDPGQTDELVEIEFELKELVVGEPIWFTVERDWQDESDRLEATVHLVSAILERSA